MFGGGLQKRGVALAGAFLLALLLPAAALAQETVTGPSVPSGPSTGTVIAAALETAGYVGQAQVLDQLGTMLNKLGALIFLVCLIAALFTIANLGQYQVGLWFLLGPPLFFFLIDPTEDAAGVEWQLGAFQDSGDLDRVLEGANIQQSDGQKVSWFFHGYNVLISDTIQQLIRIVTNDSVRQQMLFMARQSILDDLFAGDIGDPQLLQLTQFTLAICNKEMDAARLVALGQRDPTFMQTPEYKRAVTMYCELYGDPDKPFPNGPAKDYVRTLLTVPEEATPEALENVSCEELWNWMHQGVRKAVEDNVALADRNYVNSQAPADIRPQIYRDIKEKIASATRRGEAAQQSDFQCPNGEVVRTPSTGSIVPIVFAGWMIRKVYSNDPRGQMIQQLYEHAGVETATLNNENYFSNWRSRSQEVVRRFRNNQLSEATKYEAYILSKMLPYIQGAGLYVLAVSFPFFALIVLVPGKAGGFFMWCALWAWLKSWDLGWALVMVADELLWSIMPHSSFYRLGAGGEEAFDDPVTVLEAAFGGDYAYNLASYYMLVALMVTAVPVLSAHAVLGSKKAIAGIFVDGLKSFSQSMGAFVADWIAAEQEGAIDRARELTAFKAGAVEAIAQYNSLTAARNEFSRTSLIQSATAAVAGAGNQLNRTLQSWQGDLTGDYSSAEQQAAAGRERLGASGTGPQTGAAPEMENKNFVLRSLGQAGTLEGIANATKSIAPAAQAFIRGESGADHRNPPLAAGSDPLLIDPAINDYGNRTPELEAHRRQIEIMRREANFLGGMGELLLVGSAPLLLDKKTRLSAVMGTGLAQSMNKAAVDMERQISIMSVDQIKAASTYAYYEATKSDQYYFYESIRAGMAGNFGRIEHWGIMASPHDTLLSLDQKREFAEINSTKYWFQFFGNTGQVAIEGVGHR